MHSLYRRRLHRRRRRCLLGRQVLFHFILFLNTRLLFVGQAWRNDERLGLEQGRLFRRGLVSLVRQAPLGCR